MIRRWWRWLTNPVPLPGQVWDVDGVGLVNIEEVSAYTMVVASMGEHRRFKWSRGVFRSQAVLRPLTLRDVSAPPSLREVKG